MGSTKGEHPQGSPLQSPPATLSHETEGPNDQAERLFTDMKSAADVESFEVEKVDEDATVRKMNRHLVPMFFVVAMSCYLDRSNLAFAAVQFNRDLCFSKATYGLGAGIFFIGYAAFQIPSNLMLVKYGARKWLGLLLCTWGLVAALSASIATRAQFFVLRFLLGVAECGAFPGFMYHLSLFNNDRELGVAYTSVASVTAISQVIGGPLAAVLLLLDGTWGLAGWQWLFVLEGLPTIGLGVFLGLRLADTPGTAKCLTPAERLWLQNRQDRLVQEKQDKARAAGETGSLVEVICNWRVWYLGLIWLLIETTIYGFVFWCPMLIDAIFTGEFTGSKEEKLLECPATTPVTVDSWHDSRVALLSALLFAPAAAGMLLIARSAKEYNERRFHTFFPVLTSGICLMLLPLLLKFSTVLAFLCMIVAAVGAWGVHGPFLAWPNVFLTSGPAAATGFALINTMGAVGGFIGPSMIGELVEHGGYSAAMEVLAVMMLFAAALVLGFREPRRDLILTEEGLEPESALSPTSRGTERLPILPLARSPLDTSEYAQDGRVKLWRSEEDDIWTSIAVEDDHDIESNVAGSVSRIQDFSGPRVEAKGEGRELGVSPHR